MYHPTGSFDDERRFTPELFREFIVTTNSAVVARFSGTGLTYYDVLWDRQKRYEAAYAKEAARGVHWSTICGSFNDETLWLGSELIATICYRVEGAYEHHKPKVCVRLYDSRGCLLDYGREWDGTDESAAISAIEDQFDEEDEADEVEKPRTRKTPRKPAAVKGGA